MKNQPAPPAAIVVGVADVPGSRAALEWAADEAVATSRPLHVVHVLEAVHHSPVDFSGHVDLPTARLVTRILRSRPHLRVTAQTDTGSAAGALVAASHTAATLVVGAVVHSLLEAVARGSVVLRVAAHSFCPVVVVHATPVADTPAPAPDDDTGRGRGRGLSWSGSTGRSSSEVEAWPWSARRARRVRWVGSRSSSTPG